MRIALLLLTLSIQFTNHAIAKELYKSTDEHGNPIYTDIPPKEDAETIELPKANTTPAPTMSPSFYKRRNDEPFKYHKLTISNPAHDSTLWLQENPSLSININVSPNLNTRKKHQLIITVNGNVVSKGSASSITLDNIVRGTHSIQASIVDQHGKTLISSNTTEVHARRPTVTP